VTPILQFPLLQIVFQMEEPMTDIPTNPKWRDRLHVVAQIAGILACIAALTVATLTVINYRNSHGGAPPVTVPHSGAVQSGQ
jgi:hypothetical protein